MSVKTKLDRQKKTDWYKESPLINRVRNYKDINSTEKKILISPEKQLINCVHAFIINRFMYSEVATCVFSKIIQKF